ncbi:metal-dependent transcriptional regulator [Desulfurobacterium atlanticum]|uniref:Transcriptional regulator MntR n=1 Tax=Desulfurobacterium atlanticum TaxID=240169 RepID=A0A238ZGJ0_9BACT|nr:metal-dependent transcriptional regulator [Desulfurobacterium atlanticum]SNR82118.1 iron (metal) dependent repressor, DtxR family [Desulfurobacterium atlanticum]
MEEKLPPRLEDYLETIYLLEIEKGVARVKDIASERGVRMPTVSDVLKRLSERGFVDYEPYGTVKITSKGRLYAERLLEKHRILEEFMREILKLPDNLAETEGCLLEHHLSGNTVERIGRLTQFLKEKGLIDELERRY